MVLTDVDRVRLLLGESIPENGSEDDTMFSNARIQDLLDGVGGVVPLAVLDGWRAKAAEYANLVDVSEGNSARAMSDLHKNALAMVEQYTRDQTSATQIDDFGGRRGRVVIGEISRSKRYR
jgi:hypothetical protein